MEQNSQQRVENVKPCLSQYQAHLFRTDKTACFYQERALGATSKTCDDVTDPTPVVDSSSKPHKTKTKPPPSRSSRNPENRRQPLELPCRTRKSSSRRDKEILRLARSMANSVENLIGNLQGIMGDLRQLVKQIDVVTESKETSFSGAACPVQNSSSCSYGNFSVRHSAIIYSDGVGSRCRCRKADSSRDLCYSQYPPSYESLYADRTVSSGKSSTCAGSIGCSAQQEDQIKAARLAGNHSHLVSKLEDLCLVAPQQMKTESKKNRERRKVSGSGSSSGAPKVHNSGISSSCSSPSSNSFPSHEPALGEPFLSFFRAAPRLAHVADVRGVDPDLPDTSLKNWKDMIERGSADSLTPQMDWSYLVLTDHRSSATLDVPVSGRHHQIRSAKDLKAPRTLCLKSDLPGGSSDRPIQSQRDRAKLALTGLKIKPTLEGVFGVPEKSGRNSSDSVKSQGCDAPGEPGQHKACGVYRGVFPRLQQSVGGVPLGWNTCSKALPNWPSGDLSSIDASDNSEVDDLGSPYLPQHFQFPRRSSAADTIPEENFGLTDSNVSGTSSVPDTLASEGFEVQNDMSESVPSSDISEPYSGQYEKVMENRLEQLSNEVSGSDFSDIDADVGSEVVEQSLTSPELSKAEYDRDVNTWKSYTMTHIDSDEVISECASDILNENLIDTVTNPGFDDVNLNFDEGNFPFLAY